MAKDALLIGPPATSDIVVPHVATTPSLGLGTAGPLLPRAGGGGVGGTGGGGLLIAPGAALGKTKTTATTNSNDGTSNDKPAVTLTAAQKRLLTKKGTQEPSATPGTTIQQPTFTLKKNISTLPTAPATATTSTGVARGSKAPPPPPSTEVEAADTAFVADFDHAMSFKESDTPSQSHAGPKSNPGNIPVAQPTKPSPSSSSSAKVKAAGGAATAGASVLTTAAAVLPPVPVPSPSPKSVPSATKKEKTKRVPPPQPSQQEVVISSRPNTSASAVSSNNNDQEFFLECPVCTYHNNPEARDCEVCGEALPQ